MGDHHLVVVSNAEPYVHDGGNGLLDYRVPPGGVTSALEPVMRASGGTWIAYGGGKRDWEVVDANGGLRVPPEDPSYTLHRVWLSEEQRRGYYDGTANSALWPLCHMAYVRPRFEETDWVNYVQVNRTFARHVQKVVGNRKAVVFVQDYHLAMLPRFLKEANPAIRTVHFWHIPWPRWEAFRAFPWAEELLEGLLGSDLIGFHTPEQSRNFLESVEYGLKVCVDYDRQEITHKNRSTVVGAFPIGVDIEQISSDVQAEDVEAEMEALRTALGLRDRLVGIGLERADYTKGIPERLSALDRFFQRFPEYKERVVFIQIGVPSRIQLTPYDRLSRKIATMEREINAKYGTESWKPVVYLRKELSSVAILALYRLADFCIVSSLHDGMNLVAKEYVAAKDYEDGALILSSFTGAARELTDAIQVNPYATEPFAESIKLALEMPREERRRRMRAMRAVLRENNVYTWTANLLSAAMALNNGTEE